MSEHIDPDDANRDMTIMFADVAGSVELHERLGDIKAHQCIVDFLTAVSVQINLYNGKVTEIIGDEAMCSFDSADDAFVAAVAIQRTVSANTANRLGVRIGMHCGMTGIDSGHPYGDTVNVAARTAALAKSGQIMLTQDIYAQLSADNKIDTRQFCQTHFKGKFRPTQIHEGIWNHSDGTVVSASLFTPPSDRRRRPVSLRVRCNQTELEMLNGSPELLVGRGDVCGLRIESDRASRIHATLKFQGGCLVLSDRSTNGTHVLTGNGNRASDNQDRYLHHEEHTLVSNCVISLGSPVAEQSPLLVYVRFI